MSDLPVPTVVRALRESFDTGHTRPQSWRRRQLENLRSMLVEHGEEFEEALAADLAKSGVESQLTEIGFVVAEIDYAIEHLARWMRPRRVGVPLALQPAAARVVPEPLGVVLVIAPWNYPLMLALSPVVGALAAGNAVVIKPSELAPATSAMIARLVPQALDPAAVTVIEGGVDTATALLAEKFDHIFYTGSGRVARIVARAAAEHLTPVTLELGGKSPVYVDETMSLADVAKRIAWGKFMNSGQTCVAPDYVLGRAETLQKLSKHLSDAIYDLYGSAIDRNPDYGRIVNSDQFERLVQYLDDGDVVVGGSSDAESRYIAPTVLLDVPRDASVMSEEIFGPILPLVSVTGLDDALEFVNSRDKPLAAYVFSSDGETKRRWELETSSGALAFGAPALHLTVHGLPFGGVGASGMGSYHGERSFLTFSHEKAVFAKPLTPDTLGATIMPPYTQTKESLVRRWLRKLL